MPVSWLEPLVLQVEIRFCIKDSCIQVVSVLARTPIKDFCQHVTKRLHGVRDQIVRPPRHETIRPNEDAPAIINFAPSGPITRHVVIRLAHADRMCDDLQAQLAPYDGGRINPCPTSSPREQREARIVGKIERRDALGSFLQPYMGQVGTGMSGWVVVEFRVARICGKWRSIADEGPRDIPLSELNAVRVELPVQAVEGSDDGCTTLDAVVSLSEEMSNVLPSLIKRGARPQPDSVGPRQKFLLTFDCPIDYLTPDRLSFGVIGIEQRVFGFTLENESELPN